MIDENNKKVYTIDDLIWAIEREEITEVEKILNSNDVDVNNINKNDKNERTALMCASLFRCRYAYGDICIIKKLLEKDGINVNARDKYMQTALMYAASKDGHICAMKELLKRKDIYVNCQDNKGRTALMFASVANPNAVKELLKRHDIKINIQDENGKTALMHASKDDRTNIIKELIKEKYIDLNIKDNKGRTALDYASNYKIKIIIKNAIFQREVCRSIKEHKICATMCCIAALIATALAINGLLSNESLFSKGFKFISAIANMYDSKEL